MSEFMSALLAQVGVRVFAFSFGEENRWAALGVLFVIVAGVWVIVRLRTGQWPR